jgi:hypothetical protein
VRLIRCRDKIIIYNIPRDRYIAVNFFEQSSHTSVCSKKITRGRQPEGNFERQTRVLDCKKKFLAIYICPEVYSEENRPKIFFPRSIISEIFPRENFRLINCDWLLFKQFGVVICQYKSRDI